MKVLFATYPMAFHTPGGGEIQLLAYRQGLAQLGVEATLFDQWAPRLLEHDVVHFFSCVGGSWHFCNFVKQIGLPLVISASLWITVATRHLYPVEEIRAHLALADRIICNSDMECDTLAAVLDLPRAAFATVYNGVDPTFFEAADPRPAAEAFGLDGPYILNVANIEPRKNQLRLAEAMRSLPDHRLLLIGHVRDPDYADAVLRAGGGQIVFKGPLPHDSPLLRSAYAGCSTFALPSTLETPGLSALEAAATGVPLAITSEGSTREYFGDLACYVDPHDTASIAAGLAAALRGGPAAAERLKTKAGEYGWQACCASLLPIYEGVLASREAVRPSRPS